MSPSLLRTLRIALVLYAAALVVVLLNPSPAAGDGTIRWVESFAHLVHLPASLVSPGRVELGLNVVAFVPLSLLGSLLRPSVSVSTWVAAGFGGSLLVELFQGVLPDRMATHADVVANTLGAAIGATAAWAIRRRLRQ